MARRLASRPCPYQWFWPWRLLAEALTAMATRPRRMGAAARPSPARGSLNTDLPERRYSRAKDNAVAPGLPASPFRSGEHP